MFQFRLPPPSPGPRLSLFLSCLSKWNPSRISYAPVPEGRPSCPKCVCLPLSRNTVAEKRDGFIFFTLPILSKTKQTCVSISLYITSYLKRVSIHTLNKLPGFPVFIVNVSYGWGGEDCDACVCLCVWVSACLSVYVCVSRPDLNIWVSTLLFEAGSVTEPKVC
jgi:hypothetical protein